MLDSGFASLKNSQMPKAKAKGKAKATPKQKAKGDADKDKANKELQKDIKAFLGKIRINHMALQLHSSKKCAASFSPIPLWPHKCAPRLREKSSKARELAVQLNELGIPHQDVPWLNCCGSPSCSIKFMVCVRPWLKICRSATHCFEMSLRGLHVVFFFAWIFPFYPSWTLPNMLHNLFKPGWKRGSSSTALLRRSKESRKNIRGKSRLAYVVWYWLHVFSMSSLWLSTFAGSPGWFGECAVDYPWLEIPSTT